MSQKILVLDCYRHTLTVIRSLSQAGYTVTLGVTADDLSHGFVQVSRHVSTTWLHPDIIDDPANFNDALLDFLNVNPQIKLIYPVGENSVRRLAHIRADIPPGVLIAMPENDAIDTCLNKLSAYQIAEKCQIPVPCYRSINSSEELRDAIDELGFPSIVKASDSRSLLLDKKCVFVRTERDLQTLVDNWPDSQIVLIAQNEIKGPRYNCDVVAEDGQIRLYFESEIIRTDRLDYAGNSVFDRSIPPNPVHKEYCQRFVAELNYTGVALIQFLEQDRTGKSYFLESNPRTGATIALAAHCDVDLPASAVRAHVGSFSDADRNYPTNRTQSWLDGDLLGLRRAMKNREIGLRQSLAWLATACTDCLRADCHSTFSWKDPKPTLRLFWNLVTRSLFKKQRA